MSYLYWIHYPDHTDISSQGYVGVSLNDKTLSMREWRHRNKTENPILPHAFAKGAILEVVEEYNDYESALARESELRPDPQIGWNIAAGGGMPPITSGPDKRIDCQYCGEDFGRRAHPKHERHCCLNPDNIKQILGGFIHHKIFLTNHRVLCQLTEGNGCMALSFL